MKANEITHIQYKKATDLGNGNKGEITERYVIPTFVPHPNIKAIDVTDLSKEDQNQLKELYSEYTEYYRRAAMTIFSFEDWLSHTQDGGEDVSKKVKWRTFKMDNVEVLD